MSRARRNLTKPNRPFRTDASAALAAARYHLDMVNFLTRKRGMKDQREVLLFHAHLRAFLWELVAVRDVLAADGKSDAIVLAARKRVEGSAWYHEVNAFRNRAHFSFHAVQVGISSTTGKFIGFMVEPVVPHGQQVGAERLQQFWAEMKRAVDEAYPRGPGESAER